MAKSKLDVPDGSDLAVKRKSRGCVSMPMSPNAIWSTFGQSAVRLPVPTHVCAPTCRGRIYLEHIGKAGHQDYSVDGLQFTLSNEAQQFTYITGFRGVMEQGKLVRVWCVAARYHRARRLALPRRPVARIQLHSIRFSRRGRELDELGDIARHAPDTNQLPLLHHAAETRDVGELLGFVRQSELQAVHRVVLMPGFPDMLEIDRGPRARRRATDVRRHRQPNSRLNRR